MSLQERTLVVKNFDPEKTTPILLKELCLQGGPVRNVVVKPDHAFVEFEDVESVGYCKALLENVEMFGKRLVMEPKIRTQIHFKYTHILQNYVAFDKQQQAMQRNQQQQALHQQQQMLAHNQQQQGPNPITYQQYGPQPTNISLHSPPVNVIPNTNQQIYNANINLQQFNASPRVYNPNLPPHINLINQTNLQPFETNRFQVPTQPDLGMYIPLTPSQQVYNPAISQHAVYMPPPNGVSQYVHPVQMPSNLNRSRSFNDHQRPPSKWSRRK